jgi:hypothetical protein
MNFPFEAVEISFSDKSPDRLKTEERSGKSDFSAYFPGFRQPLDLNETPFSGQRCETIPNILWLQENFAKMLHERYSQIKPTEFPRQH